MMETKKLPKSSTINNLDSDRDLLNGLNQDQKIAVEHKTGPLLIVAGAGTGKTQVLTRRIVWLIQSGLAKPEEILALTFTDKAAAEMEHRLDLMLPYGLSDVWVHTFHSFGKRILEEESIAVGLPPEFNVLSEGEQAVFLGERLQTLKELKHFKPLGNPYKFVEPIIKLISRAQDELVSTKDYESFADKLAANAKEDSEKLYASEQSELAKIYSFYERAKNEEGVVDYGDLIVKLVNLIHEKPLIAEKLRIRFKFILVDEFQDTNYAQYELVKLLVNTDKNLTVVGDDDQCLPANSLIETPYGLKRIKKIKINDEITTAIGKGEIGVSRVSKIFKNRKKVKFLTFTLESGQNLTVTDNHKLFCRIEAKINHNGRYYVYLMERKNFGWRIGVTNDLITRLKLERSADLIVGLRQFENEIEARYYETLWSLKYCIPTLPFKPRKGMTLIGEYLERLFKDINTQLNAKKLADDLNIDLNAHHFALGGVYRGKQARAKIILTMCLRNYRSKLSNNYLHRQMEIRHSINLETSDPTTVSKLKFAGIKLARAKVGWRTRFVSKSLIKAGNYAEKLKKITDGIFEVRFAVGKKQFQHKTALMMPACNVLPGMYLPIKKNNGIIYEKVLSVSEKIKTTTVYDLEIDRTHNFIADNTVVHNSIYKFRGAAVSNILGFLNDFDGAKKVVLNQNYRSTQTILDRAYTLIQNNNPDRLEPKLGISKKLISNQIKSNFGNTSEVFRAEARDSCEVKEKLRDLEEPEFHFFSNERDEIDEITDIIKCTHKQGIDYSDIAILARAHSQLEDIERVLTINKIPVSIQTDRHFIHRPEIRGAIAFLKVLVDPSDSISLLKLALSPFYKADPEWLLLFNGIIQERKLSFQEILNDETRSPWSRLGDDGKKLMIKIRDELVSYRKMISSRLVEDIFYEFLTHHEALSSNPEDASKVANLATIYYAVRNFRRAGRDAHAIGFARYLEDLIKTLKFRQNDQEVSINDGVNLLTVHSAKGLEFDTVIMTNLVQGRFPSRARRDTLELPVELIREQLPVGNEHTEEERRLFYVGMTRAKRKLYLTASSNYGTGTRERKLSPFVLEALEIKEKITPLSPQNITHQSRIAEFAPIKETEKLLKYPEIDGVITLSPAKIESYLKCPKEFYWKYILRAPAPPTIPLIYGNAIHAGIEAFNRLRIEGTQNESSLLTAAIQRFHESWDPDGFVGQDETRKLLIRGEETLTKFVRNNLDTLPPTYTEHWIKIRLDNSIKINGRIDAVWIGNATEIRDYKTSENVNEEKTAVKKAKENMPLKFYGYAIRAETGRLPNQLVLDFVETNQIGKIIPTNEELNNIENIIRDVVANIRASNFDPNPGFHFCNVCEKD